MKHGIKWISLLLVLVLTLVGCAKKNPSDGTNDTAENGGTAEPVAAEFAQDREDMFSDRDFEVGYDESNSVLIQLNGDTAQSSSDSVRIEGSTVTITEEATYVISGTLNNGMILVDAAETAKLQLVLKGATVHSATSAPLYIRQADKVFLTLAADTENTLSAGDSFVAIDENTVDGALFSKEDLTLNGEGSLTVTSPAGHGIVCKDDLAITGGAYTVTSASHGLDVNNSVRLSGASLTIDAGKDGIHAEHSEDASLGFVYVFSGTVKIEAEGDGISAGAYVQIEGGDFDLLTGGGSVNGEKKTSDSYGGFMGGGRPGKPSSSSSSSSTSSTEDSGTSIKGIKAATGMLINGGTFTVDSADDALHANSSIIVNGGSFSLATGDDGFHADDTLTVTAGEINVSTSYEGLEAMHILVKGGTVKLVASDDGLNAAGGTDSSGLGGFRPGEGFGASSSTSKGSIEISGGTLYVKASGDGLDANGTLTISGGHVTVCGPTQGDTATLDYDVSGTITGGTFIGTGASGMAQSFSNSTQGVIALSVGTQSAGTLITVKDGDGNTLISYAPELSFAVVILSTPQMEKGEQYTVTVGSLTDEFEAS
ncbi:MAG: carbohydrate-binding domain-containing protein [Clostridia bacterium]|nr:carbohydrate-binding domain-containing protein [Clostridia bacterium]